MAYNDDKLSWCAGLAEQYLGDMSSLDLMSNPQTPVKLQLDEILKSDTNMIHMGDLEELGLNNEEALAALSERGLDDLKGSFSLTKESVGAKAATYAKSIFENFALLGKIMDRHQSTMHKRWLKKTNQKRRSILLEAWGPNMALSHRPDFEALDKESDRQRYAGTRFRDAFMWPYINQEDLSKPHTIFVFMSTRGKRHPSDLAAGDFEAFRTGLQSMAFPRSVLLGHCMDLSGKGDDECYGSLWDRRTQPDMYDKFWVDEYSDPFFGIMVLEVQERVLSFLVRFAKIMLHDLTKTTLLESPPQEFPPLTPETEVGYDSLAMIAAETPYREPANLDLDRIAALLAARRDDLADQIWLLREDPSYFEAQMRELKEHCPENLKDARGRQHPNVRSGGEDLIWADVLGRKIEYVYKQFEAFTKLHEEAERLKATQASYAATVSKHSKLPHDYAARLTTFGCFLRTVSAYPIGELKDGFCASPQMRQHFELALKESHDAEAEVYTEKHSLQLDPTRARIHWLLMRLWTGDEKFRILGMPNIVDELQRLIDSEDLGKSSISSYLVSIIGDLAIISECARQLDIFQAWAHSRSKETYDTFSAVAATYKSLDTRLKGMMLAVAPEDDASQMLVKLGTPADGKFAYPVGKRKTQANVTTMRDAEHNLDTFWHGFDKLMDSSQDALKDTFSYVLKQGRSLQRTAPWIESASQASRATIEDLYVPFSQLRCSSEQGSEQPALREVHTHQPKTKIKTRGVTNAKSTDVDALVGPEPDSTTLEPRFFLNQRALKVFRTLFFVPSVHTTAGEIPWTEFLYGMVSAGFAPEKLYGSVWQFSPKSADIGRSIQFHEPHGGSAKISYRNARRIGRRLNRAYGWDGSMFSLAEKSAW